MKQLFYTLVLVGASIVSGYTQVGAFDMKLEALSIPGLSGVQSFAVGKADGKWLIIGGRLDGLHKRQANQAFDVAGLNTNLTVVDPVSKQQWTAPLSVLPVGLQEQLSATNMEFHQTGDFLYIIGGYGYSNTAADHITYPNLTAVNVPNTINAIINNTSYVDEFRQITDQEFAVTGGQLKELYGTYYLIGGHRFDGRYNPMGNPSYVQTYTEAIRKFKITDDGTNLTVNHLAPIVDATNLHRRDYNVVPQVLGNGALGMTAFSGVFQVSMDLPFLNSVDIDTNGHAVNNSFTQYYNHYHCANVPIYDSVTDEMHTVFFGGMAQYYDDGGMLVQNDSVPFVKTIARVTRDASGDMAEYKMPIEMPDYFGSGSEFIWADNVNLIDGKILDLKSVTADTTLIGYIFGGIISTAPNIFWINDGSQSAASNEVFEVYLIKSSLGLDELNEQSVSSLQMQVYPNPNDGEFVIKYNLNYSGDVTITLFDMNGKILDREVFSNQAVGEQVFHKQIDGLLAGGTYLINIETNRENITQRIIVQRNGGRHHH